MTNCPSNKPKLEADLRLIEILNGILEKDQDPALRARRDELRALHTSIRDALGGASPSSVRILPDFLLANPNLLSRLVQEEAGSTLAFVSDVCDYYRSVRQQRPLTEEERNLGKQLKELLTAVQDTLQDLKGENQRKADL
jgi:hypothetical protein